MTKRRKIVATSLILAFSLIGVQLVSFDWRYQTILALAAAAVLLSIWSLRKDLGGVEWLTVLILPFFYTIGSGLFYFLLPEKWLTRLLVAAVYAFGFYALLLTENIYSVAAIRNIQLLRAAQTVGFLITLVTAFFFFDTIFSLRLYFWFNFLLVFLVTFPLVIQALWSIKLEERLTGRTRFYALIISLVLAQTALLISFWPVTVATGPLFLTAVLYILLGICQEKFKERLFQKTLKEYLWVGLAVLIVTFLITRWGG